MSLAERECDPGGVFWGTYSKNLTAILFMSVVIEEEM
jgi:hypothetical protein